MGLLAIRRRTEAPWFLAALAVATILGGLTVGYEPVGGDPDRLYRPLKLELARSLGRGELPFWSDRFGLGLPLVAESHVAAFYPPNLVLYRLLDVSIAYRWSMWLHILALVTTTYAYARRLGITPWGGALASISFSLCGFQAVHASHEPFYHAMPFLPLALFLAETYLATPRLSALAMLAVVVGVQLTLGHFQIAMWTAGLVVVTGLWRVVVGRRPASRLLGLAAAVGWGGAIAGVQLALSWEFARAVGHASRHVVDLTYYAFPPSHWAEPAIPRLFQGLRGGPEGPSWQVLQTSGFEACFYVGTVPLILAFVGFLDPGRRNPGGVSHWRWIVPVCLAMATMPRWWPAGYVALLQVPGLGLFRAPARYTLVASLGLALLAGQGLDRLVTPWRFRAGVTMAIAFGVASAAWAFTSADRPAFRSATGPAGLPFGLASAALAWLISLIALHLWRSGRVGAWAPCLVAAVELGLLYYHGPIQWGWSVSPRTESPVLARLAREPGVGRVAGVLDNLPSWVGLVPAVPYVGFTLPPANRLLREAEHRGDPPSPVATRWLRRFGVTHGVWDSPVAIGPGEGIEALSDPALDRLAYSPTGVPRRRLWRIVRYQAPFPAARVALRARVATNLRDLIDRLSRADAADEAWFLPGDAPPAGTSPRARSARLLGWDGTSGTVEHDGACDLVLTRAHDPGWLARVDEGPERPVLRADGGLQAIRIEGSGVSRISVRYQPALLAPAAAIALAASAAALVFLSIASARRRPS